MSQNSLVMSVFDTFSILYRHLQQFTDTLAWFHKQGWD